MRQADLKVTPGRHPFRRMVSNTERRVKGFAIVFPDGTQALVEGGQVTAVSISLGRGVLPTPTSSLLWS